MAEVCLQVRGGTSLAIDNEAREAIRQLYDTYQHDVYRFALYSLQDEGAAADMVQEVFLRAIKGWRSFRGEASAKTWLLTIARNYMLDAYRKERRKNRFMREYPPLLRSSCNTTSQVADGLVLEQALSSLKDS